jgi:hypothetical protein
LDNPHPCNRRSSAHNKGVQMKKKKTLENSLKRYVDDTEYGWNTFWGLLTIFFFMVLSFPFWLVGKIWAKWFVKRGK